MKTKMKIYLIERQDEIGYDETDSIVVVEESEERALKWFNFYYDQAYPLKVTHVGMSSNDHTPRIILNSFNAG